MERRSYRRGNQELYPLDHFGDAGIHKIVSALPVSLIKVHVYIQFASTTVFSKIVVAACDIQ